MSVPAPTTLRFAIRGPIARADVAGLCARVDALLGDSRAEIAICDVSGVRPDAVTVDALARIHLDARRHGCRVRLCSAPPELLELVDFMGLSQFVPCDADA
jgi:ABC-type transporter Mla MlaB component